MEQLRGRYNAFDFKLRWAFREEAGGVKTYNDEVGAWYYEVYMQPQDGEPQLLSCTPSWAAYVVDAPLTAESRTVRLGVCAVAPDGQTRTAIDWTPWQDIAYTEPLADLVVSPSAIKPDMEFAVSLKDPLASAPDYWTISDALTGDTVAECGPARQITASLPRTGLYDVEAGGVTHRGLVCVSPTGTGSAPTIHSISLTPAAPEAGARAVASVSLDEGEGQLSHGLRLTEADELRIPGTVQQGRSYTYCLWLQPDELNYDKQGINLISKCSQHDAWPHNNWGDIWVQIRPQCQTATAANGSADGPVHEAGEVSFNTFGWTSHDLAWEQMISTGYQLETGVWAHVAVTEQDSLQRLYFNGRLVAEAVFGQSSRRESSADSRIDQSATADIIIGGAGTYKAGFCGVIDDIQVWNRALGPDEIARAMKGYAADSALPEGLTAYISFESGDSTGVVAGNPLLDGTLPVTTDVNVKCEGAEPAAVTGRMAELTFPEAGRYRITATAKNQWGNDSLSVDVDVRADGSAVSLPAAAQPRGPRFRKVADSIVDENGRHVCRDDGSR